MAAHNERNRRLRAPLGLAALAALTVVGCSAQETTTTATETVTVTPSASPTQGATSETAAPESTTPAPTTFSPLPPAPPKPNVNDIAGPFQSPSGNIVCSMYGSTPGDIPTAICAVAEHDWIAPKPENCGANWGSRIDLEAGSPARFGCYGQSMPPATHTLEYGQIQKLGSITCSSESAGITCKDDSGHYFTVSRDKYLIG